MEPFIHDAYKESYTKYVDFKEVLWKLHGQICVEEHDGKDEYHLHNGFLYKLENICVPKGEILQLIKEAHTSKVVGHFGIGIIVSNL